MQRDRGLPWHLPADLKWFKATTLGHPVIMGRLTYESFGGRPLPRRRNLVISRNPDWQAEGAEVFASLPAALGSCGPEEEVFICGGAGIYAEALPLAGRLYLTRIHADVVGDTCFPTYDETR
ncbi:MAG: dihydrofolate reductase [Planctomycetes bacterium]|nr:dihydrofolate reductase [Planctomycetota bacterium]